MNSIKYILPIALLAFSCSSNSDAEKQLIGHWTAIELISSGNAVPNYLASDFEITFNDNGQYAGNLELLELPAEGTFQYLSDSEKLVISSDTFHIKSATNDTLTLFYESFSIPFDIVLTPKK